MPAVKYLVILTILNYISFDAVSQIESPEIAPTRKQKDKRLVLFPVIVKSPEYLWGAGAAGTYFFKLRHDSVTRTSSFNTVAFYTLRSQLVIGTEGNVYFPNEKYILQVRISFSTFPDRFWGLGNETPSYNQEQYEIQQYNFYPRLLRNIFSDFYLGLGYEYQNVYRFEYNRDGTSLFDIENVTGRDGGIISGAVLLATWDSRNNAFSPSTGFLIQYSAGSYKHGLGSDFDFTLHHVDIRKYFPLPKDRVLAFQFNIISTAGDTPIRDLATMGSSSYMRGYYDGRYVDYHMLAIQSEFRTPVYRRFGATLFAGVGRVGDRFLDIFTPDHLKISYGFGLRYALRPKEKLNLRVDVGFGKESQGSYINIGEAF